MVLQNCVCRVEGKPGPLFETCVMSDVDGIEELSIKVEEAIDTKDEIPEAIIFRPFKTDQEVRVWGLSVCLCELVAAHAFRLFIAPKRNCEITFSNFLFLLYCGSDIHFEIWIAILKRRDFLEVTAINGRIIFQCVLNK